MIVQRSYRPAGEYSQPSTELDEGRALIEIADAIADGLLVTATRDEGDDWFYTVTLHDPDGGRTGFLFSI